MKDPPSERALQLLAELKRQVMIRSLARHLKKLLQQSRKVKRLNVTVTKAIRQEGLLGLPLFEGMDSPPNSEGKVILISEWKKLQKRE